MGLDNIPKPHPCEVLGTTIRTEDGKIDCQKVIDAGNCEFAKSSNPVRIFGACCWFRGKVLVGELEAIGYPDISFLFEKMRSKELLEKADELEKFLEQFKQLHDSDKEKVKGAGWDGRFAENGETHWQHYSTYEEIVDTIEKGIRWLRRIGELGYKVIAWY